MENFVPFIIAKKLKVKGFDWKTQERYVEKISESEREEWDDELCSMVTIYDVNCYPKPTISQVLKWLREDKKYHVYAAYGAVSKFRYVIIQLDNEDAKHTIKRHYKTYEDAIMAGINYVINNII